MDWYWAVESGDNHTSLQCDAVTLKDRKTTRRADCPNAPPTRDFATPTMHAFHSSDLEVARASSGRPYFEFLRVPALSAGIYALPAGAADLQRPHAEDEVYCVLGGRGRIRVGDQDAAVEPGSIVYVPSGTPHRFHSVTEPLALLVVFAPAETGPTT